MTERLAIIGTGAMGLNHARTAQSLSEEFNITHIIDTDVDRAEYIAKSFGSGSTSVGISTDSLNGDVVDAAIIASPSRFHAEQAEELMKNGVNVLVEKPVALSVEEAVRLKETALETGRILMVGHVELFNPTVTGLKTLLKEAGSEIRDMRFQRLSNVTDSSRLYHDVVSDLMLHDISIAYLLSDMNLKDDAKVIAAHGRFDTSAGPDPAEAIVRFDQVDAHFRASRAYPGGKVRKIEVETTNEIFEANLLTREVIRRSSNEGSIAPSGLYTEDLQATLFYPSETKQPLTLEQVHFARAIAGEATTEQAQVSIDDAIRIMRLTSGILNKVVQKL